MLWKKTIYLTSLLFIQIALASQSRHGKSAAPHHAAMATNSSSVRLLPSASSSMTAASILAKNKNNNADFDASELAVRVRIDGAPSPARPPMPLITGCRTQGQIAMTYSEGPSDATARIARHLNYANARANFFVNASWLYTQQYAMVVQNIYNAGHLIGMMYRVKNDDPSALTDAEIRADILNKARTIETLIRVSPKYVRLHYTKTADTRTENILRDLGFILVGYNLDSQDYSRKAASGPGSVQEIYQNTFKNQKETYDAKGSFVSIQYDIPDTGTLAATPYVINTIIEEGYTMVRLDGCLNDNKPYKRSAESVEYVADKFSFGTSGYRQGQSMIPQDIIDTHAKEDNPEEFAAKSDTTRLTTSLGLIGCCALILSYLF